MKNKIYNSDERNLSLCKFKNYEATRIREIRNTERIQSENLKGTDNLADLHTSKLLILKLTLDITYRYVDWIYLSKAQKLGLLGKFQVMWVMTPKILRI